MNVRLSSSNIPEDYASNSSIVNNAKRNRSQSNNGSYSAGNGYNERNINICNNVNNDQGNHSNRPRKVNASIQDQRKNKENQRDAFNNLK
jgi:hypothetical protein